MIVPSAAPRPRARAVLPAGLARQLEDHAREAFPDECCGFLLGPAPASADAPVEVRAAERADNACAAAGAGAARSRFTIAPARVLAAHREAARRGLAVVGFYHSHPRGPARASAHDRALAWPGHLYVIAAPEGLTAHRAVAPGAPLEALALEIAADDAAPRAAAPDVAAGEGRP